MVWPPRPLMQAMAMVVTTTIVQRTVQDNKWAWDWTRRMRGVENGEYVASSWPVVVRVRASTPPTTKMYPRAIQSIAVERAIRVVVGVVYRKVRREPMFYTFDAIENSRLEPKRTPRVSMVVHRPILRRGSPYDARQLKSNGSLFLFCTQEPTTTLMARRKRKRRRRMRYRRYG